MADHDPTECVLLSCADRMFTTGEVGVQASQHLPGTDYSAVVQKALELPGFSHEPEPKFVTVGFGHQTTLGAAGMLTWFFTLLCVCLRITLLCVCLRIYCTDSCFRSMPA